MINFQPDAALLGHVNERGDDAKMHYEERWAHRFEFVQKGAARHAEALLGGYLLTITDGYNDVSFSEQWDNARAPDWGTIMGHRIEVAGHQAEFLFCCCHGNDRLMLAVTLDAADTRQRAPGAIARDRALMDAGCQVINYTDADVLSRPGEIAEEISAALFDLADKMLTASSRINGPPPTNVSPIRRR